MEGLSTEEQREASDAYHQARAVYQKHLKAAKRIVGVGADASFYDGIAETQFERRRRASVDALVHESALALSQAYSRARHMGCFKKGN